MQNFLKASTLGFLLIASQSFADDTLSSLQTDLTDFANNRSAEAYTLTTSSSNGDTAIIFRTQDGNTIDSKTYYFTPSDDERAILTRLASSGNIFLKEALEGENVLFDINGVGYTIDLDAVSQLSLNMANITETTSPTDTSIIINDKYYNINPRSYDNAQTINPTSYEAGKIATKYFQWDTENNHLVLNETGETSDNDLDITYITNPQHNRQNADLEGADLIGFNFYNLSNSSETGGAINNQSGYSIGNIASYFIENYTPKGNGGAIYNAGQINSITGDFVQNYATINTSSFGGAISNTNKTGIIGSITSNFIANYVTSSSDVHGGAIHNNYSIGSINGDFIGNYTSSSNNHSYGGAISNRQNGKITDITGNFIGNYTYSSADYIDPLNGSKNANGGAIANYQDTSTIGHLVGSFIANYALSDNNSANGGAIYNATKGATIGAIIADFIGNYAQGDVSAQGGAIYNNIGTTTTARIGSIIGDFKGNHVQSASGGALGGAIYNENTGSGTVIAHIGEIYGNFEGNYAYGDYANGGAIYSSKAIIDSITGNFENNYAIGDDTVYTGGGAVYNIDSNITFIDSSFLNNATNGYGGAIANMQHDNYVQTVINIIAQNQDVEFTGNTQYADISEQDGIFVVENGESNAIYNEATVNLNAKEDYSITFNDNIDGNAGQININSDTENMGGNYIFNSDVSGNTINLQNDGTITVGSTGSLNLDGLTNDDNHGTLNAINDTAQDLSLGAVDLNSDLNFAMDLDISYTSNIQSDTITVDGANSTGNIVISDINLTGGINIEDLEEDFNITQQILYGADEYTTITLGSDVLDEYNGTKTRETTGSDEWSGPDINWNDDFGGYTITTTIESSISVTGSDSSNILQDSITWAVHVSEGDKVYTDKADNLALVNQFETTSERNFNFDTADDEYTVIKDSGTTAGGKLVINGVQNDNGQKSTINGTDSDGQRHNLFDITSNQTTVVEINNTQIIGADTVATVGTGNTLALNNVDIKDNINSIVNNGNLDLTGNNLIDSAISNATASDGTFNLISGTTTIGNNANVEQGTIKTAAASLLAIDGTVTVTDQLDNLGTINVGNTGTLNLNGHNLEITGNIVNNNQLNIDGSGTTTNSGTISNNSNMVVSSTFDNTGTIEGTDGSLTNQSDNFNNQSTINQKTFVNDGIATNNGIISAAEITNNNTLTTNSETLISDSAINNNGTLNYISGSKTINDITGNSTGNVNISTGGIFTINNTISGTQLSLNNSILRFGQNADISQASAFNVNGGAIDVNDNHLTNTNLGNVNLNEKSDLAIDFNLSTLQSDTFDANITNNGGIFNVSNINFIGAPTQGDIRIHLGDTTNLGRDNVTSDYFELPSIMTAIKKFSGSISDGWLTYNGAGNKFDDFNPSVVATPIASLVGGMLNQSQVLQDSFYHMERYTKYSLAERTAAEKSARKAASATHQKALPETASSMWIKPYGGYEKVDLKNGTEISNTTYGMLYGADTELNDFGNGYKAIVSAFIGYNGGHQSYKNVKINQTGGVLGFTGTLYKDNFFTGITVSTGASSNKASTSYGKDKFSVLTTGIANKTGYNFEFAQGRLIVQPSVFLGFMSVNTSDYKNSAHVKIKSENLNAVQIAPGVEAIANLENNWQPYLGMNIMYNIMDKTQAYADEYLLPEMSVKPYIQYGAGVQKSWGNKFTAFCETTIKNGGRTGVALQTGFRWTFGE